MITKKKRIFALNFAPNRGEYALADDAGLILRVSSKKNRLVDLAFESGADEVRHEYDCTKADEWER